MRSALSLATLAFCATLQAQTVTPAVRWIVQSSPLAGYRHAAAPALWSQLSVGDALELAREADNPHDANAVRVDWRGRKLGYVPRAENATLAWMIDRGGQPVARISELRQHRNGRRRLEFEVALE